MASFTAIVKSVITGDTLVLRGRPGPNGSAPKERILHIAEISAPRMGTASRDDEPWAYECREHLRAHAVGKEITCVSTHSMPSADGQQRDFGNAQIGSVDLATEMLKSGWAKSKELKREPTEEDQKRKDLENEARAASKGMWNPAGPKSFTVNHTMPADSQAFINEWKGKPIDALVEQVRDGTTVRVRMFLPDDVHQYANIVFAGAKSSRASGKEGEAAEPWGEEAKFFSESRLLQRHVKVVILSLTAPAATPFNSTAPAPASIYIGNVLHPAGNIAEHLVAAGLARVVDWHAGMLSASGGMEKLRAAERTAKEKRACLYANTGATTSGGAGKAAGGSVPTEKRSFEGTVTRVWSGDQISVADKDTGKEKRLQLSSTRAFKTLPAEQKQDPKQAFYAQEAKEFVRKKLIGKVVHVHVDYIKPSEGNFEERECATIRYGGTRANIAEQLIEKGLATALRHKRDDEDRSPDYDKLMAAEQAALADTRGQHSPKDVSLPRMVNISENASRAQQFLSSLKRQGRVPALVDYVAAGSRFRLILPSQHQTLTLVLAGIRAPRAAYRGADKGGDKGEPYGNESADFATRRYLQRDVEVEFDAVDKSGGFIGALYFNKTENAAVHLVKEGLATVHAFSAENLPWAKHLFDAEAEAKKSKKNLWQDYDEEAEQAAAVETTVDTGALKAEYIDIAISDVRSTNGLTFSIQILNTPGIDALEKLMKEFSLSHRGTSGAASGPPPKGGDLVSAKFTDGQWYRAKVRRASPAKQEAEVTFIDYGNQSTVAFKDIRPLDAKFRTLAGQAQDARLSFVKLVDPKSDYYTEAVDRFRALAENKKLVANVDHREGALLHLRLMDPQDPSSDDPLACLNADLCREGLATIDRKGCKYITSYPQVVRKLEDSVQGAKKDRWGMFEFGDVEEDE